MPQHGERGLDAAMAIARGQRATQEDAVICDCPLGADMGLVVLSDGMGGYQGGDVASKIVMTEVYSELKLRADELGRADADVPAVLRRAVDGANACLRAYTEQRPEALGMGATVVAGLLRDRALHWISVGDSPLFLFRGSDLVRLNADHSYGAVIEEMVADGRMEAEAAACHPDRSSLLSVLAGGAIAQVDCPRAAFTLREGDTLVFASDGLLHLDEGEIRRVLRARTGAPAAEVAAALLQAVEGLADPEQDNVSIAIVRVGEETVARSADIRRRVAEVIAGALSGAEASRQEDDVCEAPREGGR